jgi:hypothetical protein
MTTHRRWIILTAAMAAVTTPTALAVLPQQTGQVDLLTQANIRIDGAGATDLSGSSIEGIGDVNRDGRADLAIGAPNADNNGRTDSGSTYVIFGEATPTNIDLATLGARGYRIDGAAAGDFSGASVTRVGDTNGDARPDFAIGAHSADNNGRNLSGSTYVILGQETTTNIDLAALGTRGYRIDGAAAGDFSGSRVGGVGDTNGDGRTDLAIGAADAGNNGRTESGSTYIIFGEAAPTNLDLAALGTRGYRIDGATAGDFSAISVAGVGDTNGDGRADLAIGAFFASNNGRLSSGSTYLIFGEAAATNVDLAALGTRGYRIDGATAGDVSGTSVAGVGDANGDGHSDLAIGATGADNNGRSASGSTYVIFGQATPTNIDLAALGARGYRIDGAATNDSSGTSVTRVDDTNGDGRPDLAIGAIAADNNGRTDSGSTFVIFGQATPTNIDLANLGARGYRIDGAATNDRSGGSVSEVGDMNGDGRPDLATSAQADNNGRTDSGSVYVMFGFGTPSVSYLSITTTVGLPLITTAPSTVARTGPAAFTASKLPLGLAVDPATGAISGTPARSGPSRPSVTMTDLTGTATTSLTIQVRRCVTAHVGNNRRNIIRGDKRSENITGKGGNDVLLGGANEDCISGGPGDDTIGGGPAFDTLRGGPGADLILGGSGDDDIRPGPGRDTVNAGKGNDTITARDDAPDAINCGKGKDTAIVDRSDIVTGCEKVKRA